jgi:hypothetical protein
LSSDNWSESNSDEDELIDRYYNYGDLDETGGKYRVQLVDGTEVSLEEHERFCRCGLGEGIPGYCCMDGSSDESSEGGSIDEDLPYERLQ